MELADGRVLAYDDVGDPAGAPVVYLHGTPDSRRARPPDDSRAAAAGVRLIAVDRPGAGDSTAHPGASIGALAADVAALLDHLEIARTALLGWSAGGLCALAVAAGIPERISALSLVGPVPPVEAYRDPAVVTALDGGRRHFVELAAEVPAAELGAELAPYLVPDPLTPELALEVVLEGAGERGRAELAAVPGAAEAMAGALVASVAQGVDALAADVARQLEPGLALDAVAAPVVTWHGAHDGVSPPEVGRWLAEHLADVEVRVVEDGGHHLLFPRWSEILGALVEASV